MPTGHKEMLIAHYGAPNHTITATQLAAAVGYATYNAVNLQYGTLGAKLAERMGWEPSPEAQLSYSIASFEKDDGDPEGQWRWIMHPPLARALETLGWVRARSEAEDHKRNPDWTRDELILALDLYFRRGRRQLDAGSREVIALSEYLNELPIHEHGQRGPAFRNPNSVAMKLGNFASIDPAHPGSGLPRGGRLDAEVFHYYAANPALLAQTATAIRNAVQEPQPDFDFETGEQDFPEGRLLTRRHLARERNPTLVKRKKEAVLQATGKLSCQCCGFDFASAYGELGAGFAECHHTQPIASLKEGHRTKLEDLAIVCANCHRMLHRSRPLLSVAELGDRIKGQP